VACGIRDPQQLSEVPPAELRTRIQEFLATEEGRAILTSGTEHELSRVTDWVRHSRTARAQKTSAPEVSTAGIQNHQRLGSMRSRRPKRSPQVVEPTPALDKHVAKSAVSSSEKKSTAKIVPMPASASRARNELQPSDPVRRAPSIGPVMAQRLEHVGIVTVNDLLTASPDVVAAKVGIVRITADTILRWQQQAELLCHVPALRDQGAQVLVGSGVTTVDELVGFTPAELFARVVTFAETIAGKRLLRSRAAPTITQITEWISAARATRSAHAA
jgi:predicted flap endonuclease-1-like 5' DNA nuclease